MIHKQQQQYLNTTHLRKLSLHDFSMLALASNRNWLTSVSSLRKPRLSPVSQPLVIRVAPTLSANRSARSLDQCEASHPTASALYPKHSTLAPWRGPDNLTFANPLWPNWVLSVVMHCTMPSAVPPIASYTSRIPAVRSYWYETQWHSDSLNDPISDRHPQPCNSRARRSMPVPFRLNE
eukprot:3028558-Rhodomonas_salina.5